MATEVILPRVDMDMTEGKIAHWYVKSGESISKGQVLFEIETDKATMEVDSPTDGVIHVIQDEIGISMPVGQIVGWILAAGESLPDSGSAVAVHEPSAEAAAAVPQETATEEEVQPAETQNASQLESGLRATPLARSIARENGVDLRKMKGTGPNGRILARDVMPSKAPARNEGTTDLHLNWWKRGVGTPLLLVHGFGADQASWRPLIQLLPDNQPVIAIDLPNHGKSKLLAAKTLFDMARLVMQRLDEEGVKTFHLAGHSLGGGVSLAIAELEPARIKSLTLLAPAGLGKEINDKFIRDLIHSDSEARLKAVMEDLFYNQAILTGSFVATAYQQLQVPGRKEALTELADETMPKGTQTQSMRQVLDDMSIPIKLIWGADDRIIPAHHGKDVPGQVALHIIPSVGHLPQIEASGLVAELIKHQMLASST